MIEKNDADFDAIGDVWNEWHEGWEYPFDAKRVAKLVAPKYGLSVGVLADRLIPLLPAELDRLLDLAEAQASRATSWEEAKAINFGALCSSRKYAGYTELAERVAADLCKEAA